MGFADQLDEESKEERRLLVFLDWGRGEHNDVVCKGKKWGARLWRKRMCSVLTCSVCSLLDTSKKRYPASTWITHIKAKRKEPTFR